MNEGLKQFDLSGRRALVTGGATGLGYHMARALMRSGAKVLLAARREGVLQKATERLRAESRSGAAHYHRVDLADRRSVQALADFATGDFGGIDIFIGNAALDLFEPIEKITDTALDSMFQVNVSANIELVRALLPGMRKRKWGRILFSSSIACRRAGAADNLSVYSTTKAALDAFARSVAAEAGHDGVTANSLLLGSFVTEMLETYLSRIEATQGKAAAQAFVDVYASASALGRWGKPAEIEGLIQFAASDAGSFLTGSSLVFDGGASMMIRPNPPPTNPVYPPERNP